MIELTYANRTENLLERLACDLDQQTNLSNLLQPVDIITPNRNMETWIRLGLAQKQGIAANLRFRRLESFFSDLVRQTCPKQYYMTDLDVIEGAVLAVLEDDHLLAKPGLSPVNDYLYGTEKKPKSVPHSSGIGINDREFSQSIELKRVQLASRMAYLFQEYTYSRPEMTAAWRGDTRFGTQSKKLVDRIGNDPDYSYTFKWQKALWQAVFNPGGILAAHPPAEGSRWITMDEMLLDDQLFDSLASTGLPTIHVFGVSYVARLFQLLFARLGKTGNLKLFILNPCAEFWEDMETHRELFKRLNRNKLSSRQNKKSDIYTKNYEDPYELLTDENPALRYWGRPGREHVRLLGELTECDFESAFSDPLGYGQGVLHLLQQDILMRAPERNLEYNADSDQPDKKKPLPPDETIKLVAAPSVKREVEWVAEEIWRLINAQADNTTNKILRFSDIAVIVNSTEKETYLPQIESAFSACHELPFSITDLSGTSGSSLIEAFNLLLHLPFGRFSRAEVLALLTHPSIIGCFKDLAPEDLIDFADRLGIIFGADHRDHLGTYIDEDVYNWDQGVRRLALGAFMTGAKSGDRNIYKTPAGRWLVEELNSSSEKNAALFNLLVRSLLDDTHYIAEAELTLSEWSAYLIKLAEKYLAVDDSKASDDRLRLIRTLTSLEKMDFGYTVKGRIAIELAQRTLNSLAGSRGQYLAEGVVVSSFLPMRAIPFKTIFLLGLGEGLFPAPGRRDALDLRSARRFAGDVDPAERDRYMFLETLLSAREQIYISYVNRDEQTGDPLQPSAVVQELLHVLKNSYLGEEGINAIRIEPPLRRHAEVIAGENIYSDQAREEAQVKRITDSWQDQTGRESGFQATKKTNPDPLKSLKKIVPPQTWKNLSAILKIPGTNLPETPRPENIYHFNSRADAPQETYTLSLYYLRRFLECPMQGWASAMLGLAEQEEDRASVEEEDFSVKPLLEAEILSRIYSQASSGTLSVADLYSKEVQFLRLQGKLPVGTLGQVVEKKHLSIFKGWDNALQAALNLPQNNSGKDNNRLLHLQKIRFGSSPEADLSETNLDSPVLELSPDNVPGETNPPKVKLTGLSQLVSLDHTVSLGLRPRKLPSGKGIAAIGRTFRYLLRGMLDQTILAAIDPTGGTERQAIIVYAENTEQTGYRKLTLHRPGRDEALAWLTAILNDLFFNSHAYLFPCEAVFYEYFLNRENKPDGKRIQQYTCQLARNEWSSFSSLWGPVPQPRLYPPLSPGEAAAIAERRFGLLLSQITDMEGF